MRRQNVVLLALAPLAVLILAVTIPLASKLYERPVFLWVSLAASVLAAGFLVTAPLRAETPPRRRLLCFGLAAVLVTTQALRIHRDFGSPCFWVASPSLLAAYREMVHVVEYGALAYLAYRCLERAIGGPLLYLTALAYVVTTALADETLQWLHALRVGDLRDVALDAVSGSIGLLYRAGMGRSPLATVSPAGRWTAVALLLSAPLGSVEFYLRTQTGHWICDERANCFSSQFSAVELARVTEDRRRRWKDVAFGFLADDASRRTLWVLEDHFLTEARAHFRLGNEAAAAGDWRRACGEMTLLARYYAPSIQAMGVKLDDYPCRSPTRGFRSKAFGHLETAAHPAVLRAIAAGLGLVLAALAWSLARRA